MHPRYRVPHHAENTVAVIVCVLVFTTDRRWPCALQVLGVAGCALLTATLPLMSVIAGLTMFAAGLAGRVLVLCFRRGSEPTIEARRER